MTDLSQKKKNRFLFIKTMYEESDANTSAVFEMDELGAGLSFDFDETAKIVDYLINEGLIEYFGLGGTIQLTHQGLKEVEEALENPSEPTSHFLPINIISIESMTNSSIQQGTTGSTILQTIELTDVKQLNEIVEQLKAIASNPDIDTDHSKELISEIQTLESQARSPRPKKVIIRESLKTVRNILECVAGNMLTPVFASQISHFIN